MRLRLKAGLLAIALCAVASPALAHGQEAVVLGFATAGTAAGLIGGVATAALRFRLVVGLAATIGIGVVLIGGVPLVLSEVQGSSIPLSSLIEGLLVLSLFYVVVPLVVVFFVTFGVISFVRGRVGSARKTR